MIKVAVVGFGFMGMTHSLNILKNKDLKLVAIVDVNPEMIEKNLHSKSGNFSTGEIDVHDLDNIHKYSNVDDCLDSEDVDVVNVCVHTDLHYEISKKSLLRGKHVFVEKPFCLDVKQAEELINLATEKKKSIMVGHVVRFMAPYRKLKQWIDSKEFGELRFLSLSRFSGLPGWGQWKEKSISGTSGGALFDLVIHDIDYANYVLGSPLEIKCSYLPGGMSKHDYISAMWNYKEKDVHVKIEGGNTFHSNFPFQAGYMAQFEKASIMYTTLKGDVIHIADDKSIKEVAAGDAGTGYYDEIAYFAQCLKNNVQTEECMPLSSLQSIKLCYKHL
ncbi:MAG TPA: Gfo/Idh/MocA family oxidoreductase [Bacteroidales bacterium]|nr:Gfo/Idh/MocA family oxidoreductase [Bacteroidales bacterium]HPT20791.1 Gfo/Idh/MocA family oxidoreductase [Bacteroidales bacterium]